MALAIGGSSIALVACTGDDPVAMAGAPDGAAPPIATSPTEAGPGPACSAGERECVGSVPRTCSSDGQWYVEAACSGAKPVCKAGGCYAFGLQGTIGALGAGASAGGLRLKNAGLQRAARTCGTTLCLSGGIAP